KDVRDKGGCLGVDDLAAYRATCVDALAVPYRSGTVFAAPGMTGGPTLARCLDLVAKTVTAQAAVPGPASYLAYARALDVAYKERFATMGDNESPAAPSCTTHFSVVDRHGNMCAVTQTLLSIFGSRIVAPSLGILLNNGIMWFDPEPGKPNSLAPGKRCLGNYCPVVGETPRGDRFALGAAGGRKIVGAVLQISSFLIDHGMTLEDAFHRPRMDMSGGDTVLADPALPAQERQALVAAFSVATARRGVYPDAYARPCGVLRAGEMKMG